MRGGGHAVSSLSLCDEATDFCLLFLTPAFLLCMTYSGMYVRMYVHIYVRNYVCTWPSSQSKCYRTGLSGLCNKILVTSNPCLACGHTVEPECSNCLWARKSGLYIGRWSMCRGLIRAFWTQSSGLCREVVSVQEAKTNGPNDFFREYRGLVLDMHTVH